MPAHRRQFYETQRHMLDLVGDQKLIDTLPQTATHNLTARLLRLGLAVSAFASLEKYLESRTESLTVQIASSPISRALGDKMRAFLSIEAVKGLANRINFEESSSRQAFTDNQLAALAGYSATPPSFTALGFSPRGSNVSESDVSSCLTAFGLEKPWTVLGSLATAVGSTRLNLKADFEALAKRRHRSAHNASSNIPTGDLRTHIETCILIGVCFDCISHAISRCMSTAPNYTAYQAAVRQYNHSFRFIDAEIGGTWVERTQDGRRVRKRYPNESDAIAGTRARVGDTVIVVRDNQGIPLAVA